MDGNRKRLLLVFLAAAMLLSFAGCGASPSEETTLPAGTPSEPAQTGGTGATEETKAGSPEVDAIDAYAPLLKHFYLLVSDPYGEDDGSDGCLGVQENARLMEDSALDGIGYTIQDLSGDGIPELAVGNLPEYGGRIHAVYTLVDGEPQFVFEGWYRSSYSYLGEGRFFWYVSCGAAETGHGIVSLTRDATALEVESFCFTQLDGNGETHVYYNETGSLDPTQSEESEMTLADFLAWEPEYADLPMVSFSSYGADNGYEYTEHDSGPAIYAVWAEDTPAEMSDYETFIADDREYSANVVFHTVRPVTDFELLRLSIREIYDDGTISYNAEPLYAIENLIPDCPLMVRMAFPEGIPAYGISYVDKYGDGMTHRLTVEISGKDGSLILQDIS